MPPLIGLTTSTTFASPSVYDQASSRAHMVRAPYVDAIVRAGGAPILIPSVAQDEVIESVLDSLDGLLLPGGDDPAPETFGQEPVPGLGDIDPDRDASELALIRRILNERPLPILAICRGIQILNVAAGGTLIQDIPAQVESPIQHRQRSFGPVATHTVHIEPGTRLHGIFGAGSIRTNTYHHQAVDRVADGFVVSARAEDGIIEGLERPGDPFIVGVQCHPESLAPVDHRFQKLFDDFIKAVLGSSH